MVDDVFDTLIKAFRDVKRAREKVEGISLETLDNSSHAVVTKIYDEAQKIIHATEKIRSP